MEKCTQTDKPIEHVIVFKVEDKPHIFMSIFVIPNCECKYLITGIY